MEIYKNSFYQLNLSEDQKQLVYISSGTNTASSLSLPVFEINGKAAQAGFDGPLQMETKRLKNSVTELSVRGKLSGFDGARLLAVFRLSERSPILRLRYELTASEPFALTKTNGKDRLTYLKMKMGSTSDYTEVQLSNFDESVHSFCICENEIGRRFFENNQSVMGPILLEKSRSFTRLLAYEHGSQVPDRFIEFRLTDEYEISVCAVKGSYWDGEKVSAEDPYETVWLQFGVCTGGEDVMASHYRNFVLHDLSVNTESRKPYVFYNTWAFQERNKWWNHKNYLDSMNEEHILKEIEVAHAMGIEVFVLDTGWFLKTGDWTVRSERFSDNLGAVKSLLDKYGMKLGLWFDPQAAAMTSRVLKENWECTIKNDQGQDCGHGPVWESEESYRLCLVSRYYKAFANELIRLVKEVGVTYFKWDAIYQYGCYGSEHYHGGSGNTAQERADCYAFRIGIYMSKVVDMLCEACPEAIVDFDITEGQRYVGLGFLSSGKYFLMNNGPYFHNFNIQKQRTEWSNVLVHPGAARARVCRTPLSFDKWIPSVLFLTHYLPDDPEQSQIINIASLILGQNGIWGDLLHVSQAGIKRFHDILDLYKKIRDDITESFPITMGAVGGSPEIHEKINSQNGRGAVVIFAENAGSYGYVTQNTTDTHFWCNEDVTVSFDKEGRAVIGCTFSAAGAKIILFGV